MSGVGTTETPGNPSRRNFGFFGWVGVAALIAVVWGLIHDLGKDVDGPPPSYGPPEASDLSVVVAPSVRVEVLAGASSLAFAKFEEFDVSPSGEVVVRLGDRLFDLRSGDAVTPVGHGVASFAFVGEALTLSLTLGDSLGALDGAGVKAVGPSPVAVPRLVGAADGSRLLVLRGIRDDEGATPAIVAMRPDAAPEAMTGSFEPVDAAAGDEIRVVYAVGSALYQVVSTGRQSLALALPDASQRIFGVAIDGEATWFSTSHAVYALTDGLAVPVVTGIGGALRAAAGALYVLDAVHRRVYRIVPRDGGAP